MNYGIANNSRDVMPDKPVCATRPLNTQSLLHQFPSTPYRIRLPSSLSSVQPALPLDALSPSFTDVASTRLPNRRSTENIGTRYDQPVEATHSLRAKIRQAKRFDICRRNSRESLVTSSLSAGIPPLNAKFRSVILSPCPSRSFSRPFPCKQVK